MKKTEEISLQPEKRKAERVRIPLKVKYKLNKKNSPPKEAAYENISGLGVRLCMQEHLTRGDVVEVLISKENNSSPFSAICKVCWCKKLGEDKFQAGLEFVKIKDRLQFIEFLCAGMLDLSFKTCSGY